MTIFVFKYANGGVPERLKGMVLKTIVAKSHREFESHPHRHFWLKV